MPVWARTPCRTIVRRHFVLRHFSRTGRLTLQINLPSALLHGGPFFRQNAKMDVKTFFFCARLGSYPCRTTVRRHFVPRHFFRIGRLMKQINLSSALLHGGPFFRQNAKMDVKTFFFCACFGSPPLPHVCAAALHATTLLLGVPAKESPLWCFLWHSTYFLHFGILLCNIACINTVL